MPNSDSLQPVWGPEDVAAAWALAQTFEAERGELVVL